VLPSVWNRTANVHAVLIVGLAPRTPYDRFYQAWIKTLHRDFSNEVISMANVEARNRAKQIEEESIVRGKELSAKEEALEQQEAALVNGGIPRMLKIMGAARFVRYQMT
jgi:ribosomal protein S13